MALPKRRKSHARVRTRQQQWRAKKITSTTCEHCGAVILPHRACLSCGYYKGIQVLATRDRSAPRPESE